MSLAVLDPDNHCFSDPVKPVVTAGSANKALFLFFPILFKYSCLYFILFSNALVPIYLFKRLMDVGIEPMASWLHADNADH